MTLPTKRIILLGAHLGRTPLALITGGSSGMGACYAEQLASGGCNVILVSNQEGELREKAAELKARFEVEVYTLDMDLARPDSAEKVLEYCDSQGLEVDILVNNAGMYFFKELHREDVPKVETMLRLHVDTVTKMCILFGERMKRRGCGFILIVSSMTARIPMPGITIYAATKAYLKSFGKSYYFEMRPYGIGVTTVCPAAIATPLYKISPDIMKIGVGTGVIKTPQWLVRKALGAMFRRRRCISPSFMNIVVPALIALLPNRLVTRIWKKLVF